MTREEAIEILSRPKSMKGVPDEILKAHAMAIKALEQEPCEDWYDVPSDEMTLGQARQAVKDLRKMWAEHLEQESCGKDINASTTDAIDRDELLKAMDTWDKFGYTETGCFVREPKNDCVKYIHYDDVIKCIKGMSPVTPQSKTGRWIDVNKGKWNTIPAYKCSECEANADLRDWSGKSPFCPWCGAKMAESEE